MGRNKGSKTGYVNRKPSIDGCFSPIFNDKRMCDDIDIIARIKKVSRTALVEEMIKKQIEQTIADMNIEEIREFLITERKICKYE